jgi:hypothetical protein
VEQAEERGRQRNGQRKRAKVERASRFGMGGSRVRGTLCGKGCSVWVGVGLARCAERAVRFGMVGSRVRGTECGKGSAVRYGWE